MAKNKTDAQTANEEQAAVAGVLDGDSNTYTDGGVTEGLSDTFQNGVPTPDIGS